MNELQLTLIAVINRSVHWLILGLMLPVLAIFQLDRGLNLVHVGLTAGVYSLVTLLLELPTGGLADTLGRRRVYLLSLVVHLAASLILIRGTGFPVIAAAFALFGAGRALSSGCMDAWFIDAFESLPEKGSLQRFLGRVGASIPFALGLAGLAGGFLAEIGADGDALFGDRYALLFVLQAAATVAQIVLTLILIPPRGAGEAVRSAEEEPLSFLEVFRTAVRYGVRSIPVLRLLAATAFWGVAFAALEQFWQPFVADISALASPTRLFGYLTAGYFLAGAVGSLAANLLFGLIGERYAGSLVVLRVLIGAGFILLASSGTVGGFAFLYLLIFLLNGVCDSPEQALFNRRLPPKVRSTMLSFQSLFLQAGGGAAGIVWGLVAYNLSVGAAWRIAGALFLVSAVLFLGTGGEEPRADAEV